MSSLLSAVLKDIRWGETELWGSLVGRVDDGGATNCVPKAAASSCVYVDNEEARCFLSASSCLMRCNLRRMGGGSQ